LLDYALFQSNNKLSRAYLYRIAGSLMREGVDDPYEAMLFLNNSKAPKRVAGNSKKIAKEESKSIDNKTDDEDYNKALVELRKLRENALDKR
jgi:replication initiation and membrane attachment protein DnaB